METPKYQIFVSSTYEDLKGERSKVVQAILEIGHIPVGMEMFSAGDEEQWSVIQRTIVDCDYYVVVLAHRYGSMDGDLSFTEKEYDFAVESGIPILGFIIDDSAAWPANKVDTETLKVGKMKSFKEKVKERMVQFWSTPDQLPGMCAISLVKAFSSKPRPGWVKASSVLSVDTMSELSRLSAENAELRKQLKHGLSVEEKLGSDQEQEALEVLDNAHVPFRVCYADVSKWELEGSISLRRVFLTIAPQMRVECEKEALGVTLGFQLRKDEHRKARGKWPIPTNALDGYLADLEALDLIEPSDVRHQLKDKGEYWTLSELGKRVLRTIRHRVLLIRAEEGRSEGEAADPEQSNGSTKKS